MSCNPIRFTSNYYKQTYLEGQVLDVLLDRGVTPSTANQSLGVKNSVFWVRGQLVLRSITNQTLTLAGEGNVRWGDTVTLVVGNDLHTTVLEHSDTEKNKTFKLLKTCSFFGGLNLNQTKQLLP